LEVAATGEGQDNISERIKRLRGKLGVTQPQLAQHLGVSLASVKSWESGQGRPAKNVRGLIAALERRGLEALDNNGPPANRDSVEASSLPNPPHIDFSSDPEIVRTVAEGERLAYGYQFNPAFAAETSLIDPLPHQRIAVYRHMLTQPRLRFLLADDAGAGKTIMAGLYIREMLARHLIHRILIVPPAGLVGNWKSELRTLFNLSFDIIAGSDARNRNPFAGPGSDQVIVSVDTLAGEKVFARLQEPSTVPYDLVVFDEAHKLSANADPDGTVRKTYRYELAEALAGVSDLDARWRLDWHCRHLLLLTATPHMGKDFPYFCLWRLLEPRQPSTCSFWCQCPSRS
jgi:transcriptional regulator with XRE-family HTH domain